jgi:GTPase SAR1 family protein
VVDSSDEQRLAECSEELQSLLAEEALVNVPLLVFANKQDLQFALDAEEVRTYRLCLQGTHPNYLCIDYEYIAIDGDQGQNLEHSGVLRYL